MPFTLKPYQEDCLAALRDYFQRVFHIGSNNAADLAFYEKTNRPYHAVPQLPFMPYVCLRIPTGGGKTLLAAHAIGVATNHYLRVGHSLVLWLAPTNTIVDQTLKALRDRKHPYRQAIDADFGGAVSVISMDEALYVQPGVLASDTVVIVSTLQSIRVNDTESRKFYDANGHLMAHFTGLTARQIEEMTEAEAAAGAPLTPSLANLIRLHHPIVLMDEAHNARTPLAFDTFGRIAPSCIIELTATPDQSPPAPSNILYHCSAAQLKADGMIKLPIKLKQRALWKEAVQSALARRAELEKLAIEEEPATGQYIRPIVLFQAQNESQTRQNITAETLKQSLIDDFQIPPEQIAISTGKLDELSGVNVLDRASPIRCIVTVQKLKEGWDCPFAYVLCSVTNLSSATAVEQILGRVLRMPYAKKRLHNALNQAYAYATSNDLVNTAKDLVEAVELSGFSKFEAKTVVAPEDEDDAPLFQQITGEPISAPVEQPPDLTALPLYLAQNVKYDANANEIVWTAPKAMADADKKALADALKHEPDKSAAEKLYRKSRGMEASPAAMGELFHIPVLAVKDGEQYELFEDQFADFDWKLGACDAVMGEKEFTLPTGQSNAVLVDVDDKGKVTRNFIEDIQNQLMLYEVGPKDAVELAAWLAKEIKPQDVVYADAALFLHKAVKALMDLRGYTLEQLLSARFRLRDSAANKIDFHRRAARKTAFDRFLAPDWATPIEVTPAIVFKFPPDAYPINQAYEGSIKFKKHYYSKPAQMNAEEAECAARIDIHPKVKYWVRNIVRANYAFSLRLPDGYFYPDFVAQLHDGRYVVIEYKGKHLSETPDTIMKTTVGKLWQKRSNGKCIFLMALKTDVQSQLDGV